MELLSICYMATLLLRIPMTVADVHKWVNDGRLLYYRASQEVPLGMRERLPPRYQLLLEPQDLLPPERLHKSILEILTMYNKEFGMAIPPINGPLVLYRWVRDLALPIEIFAACQRLGKILSIDDTFILKSKAGTNVVLRYPEPQLMALVVVATKLLFPFDDIERQCHTATDLSSLSLNWDAWTEMHKTEEDSVDKPRLSFNQAFDFSEADCLTAADETLDAYLDWFGDNLASEDIREHGQAAQDADLRRKLFRMFPNESVRQAQGRTNSSIGGETSAKKPRPGQGPLLREAVIHPSDIGNAYRVGSFYRRFRSVQDLSGPAQVLYEKAAALAGLSLESLVQAVFSSERKLEKKEEHIRKSRNAR